MRDVVLRGRRVDRSGETWSSLPITLNPEVAGAEADYWEAVLRARRRWNRGDEIKSRQAETALSSLIDELGFDEDTLKQAEECFVSDRILEVALDDHPDGQEIPASWRLPWEYLLASWMRTVRSDNAIVRRLGKSSEQVPAPPTQGKVLYVESLPGSLDGRYTFDSEEESLRLLGLKVEPLRNPTVAELAEAVQRHRPVVVHLAGLDVHQAVQDYGTFGEDYPYDGMVFAHGTKEVEVVPARELADAICCGSTKPRLVVVNLYNSSRSICPWMVAKGADAALGFQGDIDDVIAELLIAEIYRFYGRGVHGRPLLCSFAAARNVLRSLSVSQVGTGAVLWTRTDHVSALDWSARSSVPSRRSAPKSSPKPLPKTERSLIEEEAVVPERLNYALLHNHRPLFEKFVIRNRGTGMVCAEVEVVLTVGRDPYRWTGRVEFAERVHDLTDRISLPLTWRLEDMPSERVRTTVAVTTTWACDLSRDTKTHPVTMEPVDSWIDDDDNRQWLPSFVLPSDPGVSRVIRKAQRNFVVLADDASAGFGGYQLVDPEADDPFALVDKQAQAIWGALALKGELAYVNPPPSYGSLSQRIRTPSATLAGRRGTCIDLALMLAACLEYVDIYPTVFLLEGHAFAGYWRSEEGYWDFVTRMVEVAGQAANRSDTWGVNSEPWIFPAACFPHIIEEVHRTRQLVPLEATELVARNGFWNAVDLGYENLRSAEDFHSMIDIRLARDHLVTPLPYGMVSA